MIRLLVLLVATFTTLSAKQSCHSCTSASNPSDLNKWNWRSSSESFMISNLKFNSPNCDTYPWAADNSISCDSVCLKWQFTYTVSGETKYYTVRGCANQLLYNFPATESCQQPQYMSGGDYNAVGGGQAGESRLCFCTGDYCNPATKTAAFGSGALLLTALLVRMYL